MTAFSRGPAPGHPVAPDPLAVLGALPGVPESVESVRQAVDRVYGHRVMRRRSNEVASEAALRGARASAALAGADWPLEEVRRRSDFSADPEARTVGAALRLTAEAGQLLSSLVWDDGRNPDATTRIPVIVHPSASLSSHASLPPHTRVITPEDLVKLQADVENFVKELAAGAQWSDPAAVREALVRNQLTADTVLPAHSRAVSLSP